MESVGQAARRLLERLERAAKAKEKVRGTVSGCCLTPTEPLSAGENVSPIRSCEIIPHPAFDVGHGVTHDQLLPEIIAPTIWRVMPNLRLISVRDRL